MLSCPLERIPVFVRGGAVIPMLPENVGNRMDFTFLEARIYAGNGTYCLRDEGKIEFTVTMREKKADVTLRASADIATRESGSGSDRGGTGRDPRGWSRRERPNVRHCRERDLWVCGVRKM